jgi:hypothetical protein
LAVTSVARGELAFFSLLGSVLYGLSLFRLHVIFASFIATSVEQQKGTKYSMKRRSHHHQVQVKTSKV